MNKLPAFTVLGTAFQVVMFRRREEREQWLLTREKLRHKARINSRHLD